MKKVAPLKVACVGAGYFSQFHYQAWQRMEDVDVVAICNRDIVAAQQIAASYGIAHCYSDVRTMLEEVEVDLIDIITPPVTHKKAVETAIEFGVDVICQKPFGENLAQAEVLTNAAKTAGVSLCIHENFRFMPWIREIKKLLSKKLLGDIYNVRFAMRTGDGQGSDAYLSRQPYFQTMPKLLIHETAVHFIDCFRYLFGEPDSLYASLKRCNPVIKGEDAGLVIFEYPKSLTVTFDGNRLLDHASSNPRRTFGEMLIEGTQGSLRLDGEGRLYLREFAEVEETVQQYQWRDENFGGDCVYALNRHVADHHIKGSKLENSAEQYLKNIKLEEAIYHSHAQGKRVVLKSPLTISNFGDQHEF